VADSKAHEDASRQLALEFAITFCEKCAPTAKKLPQFVEALVVRILHWLVGVNDEPGWEHVQALAHRACRRHASCMRARSAAPIARHCEARCCVQCTAEEDGDFGDDSFHAIANEALARLSTALGGKVGLVRPSRA
jgi:hypothetical protein